MFNRHDRLTYLPNRREVMIKGIAGALAIAGFGSRTGTVFASVPGVTNGETPGLEEGPFWVDGQVERVDCRADSVTALEQSGTPLYLGLIVSQLSDTAPYTVTPLVGAKVDIWNANSQGVYSDEASESTTGTDYMRGYQITDSQGKAEFLTIYSGWYSGRTPHVHIRVRTYTVAGVVAYNWCTQLFFDDTITAEVFAANSAYDRTQSRTTYNTGDRVLTGASENGSPEADAGDYTMMTLADDSSHVQATFHIILDLSDSGNDDPTGGTEGGGSGPAIALTQGGTTSSSSSVTPNVVSGGTAFTSSSSKRGLKARVEAKTTAIKTEKAAKAAKAATAKAAKSAKAKSRGKHSK